jgi:hypothetical protein
MRPGSGCCCLGAFLEAAFEPALEERLREAVDFLAVAVDAFWFKVWAEELPAEAATPFDVLVADFFLVVAESGAPWRAVRSGCQARTKASSGIRTRPVARRGGCTIASLPNGRV